jgi:hypothetical protein
MSPRWSVLLYPAFARLKRRWPGCWFLIPYALLAVVLLGSLQPQTTPELRQDALSILALLTELLFLVFMLVSPVRSANQGDDLLCMGLSGRELALCMALHRALPGLLACAIMAPAMVLLGLLGGLGLFKCLLLLFSLALSIFTVNGWLFSQLTQGRQQPRRYGSPVFNAVLGTGCFLMYQPHSLSNLRWLIQEVTACIVFVGWWLAPILWCAQLCLLESLLRNMDRPRICAAAMPATPPMTRWCSRLQDPWLFMFVRRTEIWLARCRSTVLLATLFLALECNLLCGDLTSRGCELLFTFVIVCMLQNPLWVMYLRYGGELVEPLRPWSRPGASIVLVSGGLAVSFCVLRALLMPRPPMVYEWWLQALLLGMILGTLTGPALARHTVRLQRKGLVSI